MPAASQPLQSARPLVETLASRGPCPPDDALQLIERLAAQLDSLHAAGRTHRGICASAVQLADGDQPLLADPPEKQAFGGESSDPESCPPEFVGGEEIALPSSIAEARSLLARADLRISPEQIDIYQLGVLLCRMLTGEGIASYLYRPTGKVRIPALLRPLVERMLGHAGDSRFADCRELLDALHAARQQLATSVPVERSRHVTRPLAAADTTPSRIQSAVDTPSPDPNLGMRESPAALPFERAGSYRIVSLLGSGGMGDVYLAHDESLDRKVAMKVLPPQLARQEDFVRRFRAEASAVAKLVHPNVVPVYALGEERGYYFFVMQFVEGESLAQLLARKSKLPVAKTLEIAEQCLAGLAAAHVAGLVHRDIKPSNVLIDSKAGRALLADFGLVKMAGPGKDHTATGMVLGTADYLSPEQARGLPVDARSDLYALGVMLYEMLSGRLPFVAESATAMIFQHAYEPPPPLRSALPDAPAWLEAMVGRLLQKQPADRYQRADDVLTDLPVREGRPISSATSASSAKSSVVMQVPRFEPPPMLPEIEPQKGRFSRLRWWGVGVLNRYAPERIKELQNTQLQMDGAIVEYERRSRRLAAVLAEARSVERELAEQLEINRAARDTAEPAQRALCSHHVTLLTAQLEQQRHEMGEIELQSAKVDATLARLRSQRDLLLARLKTAEAQSGQATARRIARRRIIVGAMVAALAATIWLVWMAVNSANRGEVVSLPADPPTQPAPIEQPVVRENATYLSDLPLVSQGSIVLKENELLHDVVHLGGKELDHGVRMHPPIGPVSFAQIVYDVQGKYAEVAGVAGLSDKMTANRAETKVHFAVYGDNNLLWRSLPMQERGVSEEVRASIVGVKKLALVVMAEGGNRGAEAVWGNMRVVAP